MNPITFAEQVRSNFLNYQLTRFPLRDPELANRARDLLFGVDHGGRSPLLKGPFLSLSKPFRPGPTIQELVDQGRLHPAMAGIMEYPGLYAHQHEALRAVERGKHPLVATGTGSGKTEAFLVPVIDHCLRLRDAKAPPGVAAVLIYPMNALAIDQQRRLRRMLAGSGIDYGLYIGSTPRRPEDVSRVEQLSAGASREDLDRAQAARLRRGERVEVAPHEERTSEFSIAQRPPRILLTNVKQLEILLTRPRDLGLFAGAPLRFLILDEAHTFEGAGGAEVACLLRRLRAFAGCAPGEVTCFATSATVHGAEEDDDLARSFAHRLLGVPAEQVALIEEVYREEDWPQNRFRPAPSPGLIGALDQTLRLLESDQPDRAALSALVRRLSGRPLSESGSWREALRSLWRENELVVELAELLSTPRSLEEAIAAIEGFGGRSEGPDAFRERREELLSTLALGAAAVVDNEPLLRPKLHFFFRGLQGAVAVPTPAEGRARFEVFLSEENARERHPDLPLGAFYPLLVCKRCGQHFLEARFEDLDFDQRGRPEGGHMEGGCILWPAPENDSGGSRVVFTDRFIAEDDDEQEEDARRQVARWIEQRTVSAALCRYCGTLHRAPGGEAITECRSPSCRRPEPPVNVLVVNETPHISSCPSCKARGRRFGRRSYEPIQALRATNVADVHILAQDMLNAAPEDRRKIIIFADNRQEAAFQSGWIRDHARRYRFRHLVYAQLQRSSDPVSVGDIEEHLFRLFNADEDLARALCPEVYAGRVREAFGRSLGQILRDYIRIQVLRELTTSFKQRDGLEPWGVMRVVYKHVEADDVFIRTQARVLGLSPDELADAIASLLDLYRRSRLLRDPLQPIFSRYWRQGDLLVQRGFLPYIDAPPKGLKLRLERAAFEGEGGDNDTYLMQLISNRGQTLAVDFLTKLGLDSEQVTGFLEELWVKWTEDWRLLTPAELVSNRGSPLAGTNGAMQVCTRTLGLLRQARRFRCQTCQRIHARPTPGQVCTGYRCRGRLAEEELPREDYNVAQLGSNFTMTRPEEHTAQVPAGRRAEIEERFRTPPFAVNALVASPTLELGVDIGGLDMVLLRNVPPRAANYWQRAGRAGRRDRMATIITYCRQTRHDAHFFRHPERLLRAALETPRFNLRNPIMIRKHVHAIVIGTLWRWLRRPAEAGRPEDTGFDLSELMSRVFPMFIRSYLFEPSPPIETTGRRPQRRYRQRPFDVSSLGRLVALHHGRLLETVEAVFAHDWPGDACAVVTREALGQFLSEMSDELQAFINRLFRRLQWARVTRQRLQTREEDGLLDDFDRQLRRRCEGYLRSLFEESQQTYTLIKLATEGFLPGYGIYEGGITARASRDEQGSRGFPFELNRSRQVALREFIPGNMLYANGGRFKLAYYNLPIEEDRALESYAVNPERRHIRPFGGGAGYQDGGALSLQALPISDCDLSYVSRISDEEDNRFQLRTLILGLRRRGHRGGRAFEAGRQSLQHLLGQRLRLVNAGPLDRVSSGMLGFPICSGCGAIRSPYASQAELRRFQERHQASCGLNPEEGLGLYADSESDGLLFQDLESYGDAVNLGEALRLGASRVVEMGEGDLETLVFPHEEGDRVDLFLFDPMPGGSGLLDQVLESWTRVIDEARLRLLDCPRRCETSCYACLKRYENAFYHSLLNRGRAAELLGDFSDRLELAHPIGPDLAAGEEQGAGTTNRAEDRLLEMLRRAGFPEPRTGVSIEIGPPYGRSRPDFVFDDPYPRVAVFLDGMSEGIHGNADQQRIDREIRELVEDEDYQVIAITASDLDDPRSMRRRLRALARALQQMELRESLRQDDDWYVSQIDDENADAEPDASTETEVLEPFVLEQPPEGRAFVDFLPLYSLSAAAGAFIAGEALDPEGWVPVHSGRRLDNQMFVIRVLGQSMNRLIPSGSLNVFRRYSGGSRRGRIVLAQHRDIADPETGGSYTVKVYERQTVTTTKDSQERRSEVRLEPRSDNPSFQAIVLRPDVDDDVSILAEHVEVLDPSGGDEEPIAGGASAESGLIPLEFLELLDGPEEHALAEAIWARSSLARPSADADCPLDPNPPFVWPDRKAAALIDPEFDRLQIVSRGGWRVLEIPSAQVPEALQEVLDWVAELLDDPEE